MRAKAIFVNIERVILVPQEKLTDEERARRTAELEQSISNGKERAREMLEELERKLEADQNLTSDDRYWTYIALEEGLSRLVPKEG